MKLHHMRRDAIVVLAVVALAIALEIVDLFPGLTLLTESFPTYHHKQEAAVIMILLLGSLITLAFGTLQLARWSVVCIGSLFLLSCIGLANNLLVEAPSHAKFIWLSGNVVTSVLLGWVAIRGLIGRVASWRDMRAALLVTVIATVYLLAIPKIS